MFIKTQANREYQEEVNLSKKRARSRIAHAEYSNTIEHY